MEKDGVPEPRTTTREFLAQETKTMQMTAWISAAITSGASALFAVLGVSAVVLGGAWVVIDRSEAGGVRAAQGISVDLAEHKKYEEDRHARSEQRQYDTQTELREIYRVMPRRERSERLDRAPEPIVGPSYLPDGGNR